MTDMQALVDGNANLLVWNCQAQCVRAGWTETEVADVANDFYTGEYDAVLHHAISGLTDTVPSFVNEADAWVVPSPDLTICWTICWWEHRPH
jgi:hypothetical protein